MASAGATYGFALLRGQDSWNLRAFACGHEKKPDPGLNEYGNRNAGYPAGELYTGHYHRSLRLAADALTHDSLTRIMSALHGLVDLKRPLHPYDVTIGDDRAVTPERLAEHAVSLGVHDADVIFLGGRDYAELLASAIPHLHAPLSGGMGEHRGLCKQAREDSALRETWWTKAAARHNAPSRQTLSAAALGGAVYRGWCTDCRGAMGFRSSVSP